MTIRLFNFMNKKIEYHFIRNIEKGGIPDILKSVNKNKILRLILLIIIEFLNILKSEKRKIKDISVRE